jgi:hypothetical protein
MPAKSAKSAKSAKPSGSSSQGSFGGIAMIAAVGFAAVAYISYIVLNPVSLGVLHPRADIFFKKSYAASKKMTALSSLKIIGEIMLVLD